MGFDKNTEEYAWSDIKVMMLGKIIPGLRSVKYGTKQEKEAIYGTGNKPVAMGRGNKSYTCEVKLLQSELEAIIASGGGDPTNIPPFDIVIAYVPVSGLPMKTDVIKHCEFTDVEKASNQGDKFHEITMPVACLDIKYNTVK